MQPPRDGGWFLTGTSRRPLIAFANRLPIVQGPDGWRSADGGLASALRPALQGGTWVGWDGGTQLPSRVEGLDIDLIPVPMTRTEVQSHYYGFSNRTLWPLLHDLIEQPVFEERWWSTYREINQRFAEAIVDVPTRRDPILWVHDYHLMLVPRFLREVRSKSAILYFLHTPFPAPELFSRVPWRRELLSGLLGADVVSFHTEAYRANFMRTCAKCLEECEVEDSNIRMPDGRIVRTTAHPISIDAEDFSKAAVSPRVQQDVYRLKKQFIGRRLLLGVDRLDYTKGIFERLRAFEAVLERRADLRRKISLVQIAIPSRSEVKEYRQLRASIEAEVGRINGRFTEPGGEGPVKYMHRTISKNLMLAYYRVADVALVTPLKDGMNLVAKEFVVTQGATEGSGVLILSEFAGAAEELVQALMCNPYDIDDLADRMEEALAMPLAQRAERMAAMAETVGKRDVKRWVSEVLADVPEVPSPPL